MKSKIEKRGKLPEVNCCAQGGSIKKLRAGRYDEGTDERRCSSKKGGKELGQIFERRWQPFGKNQKEPGEEGGRPATQ